MNRPSERWRAPKVTSWKLSHEARLRAERRCLLHRILALLDLDYDAPIESAVAALRRLHEEVARAEGTVDSLTEQEV